MKTLYTFYIVHCFVDERKYVGCTSYTLEKRWGDHRSAARTSRKTPFHREMYRIGIDQFYPELLFQEEHSRASAVVREEELISKFNSRSHGFNGTWAREGSNNGWHGKGASNANFTDPEKNPSRGVLQKSAKAVRIEGEEYPSLSHAARALELDRSLVSYRVKSKSRQFSGWKYCTGAD